MAPPHGPVPGPAGAAAPLVEIFAAPRDAGAIGFALAQIPARRPVLWVQDRMSAVETGRPYGRALARFGMDPGRVVLVCARTAADVLWAMEEGLGCTDLGAVIGEIRGDPKALDLTATKRLALRAERGGARAVLIRSGAAPGLSAARWRWRVDSAASAPRPHDPRAPGEPRWRAELFRARGTHPDTWEAEYDAAAHRLDLSAPLRDPAAAPAAHRRAGAGGG